jgi:subfamily B ATP-binding cassette protein MsbA
MRRMLYQHIQRLSLAEHGKSRSGDLITRITSDIEAVRDFINSALLGMLVNVRRWSAWSGHVLLDWRFTLIALSVMPVLFVVVYSFTRRIKKASRDVRKKGRSSSPSCEEVLTRFASCKAFTRRRLRREAVRFGRASRMWKAGLHARAVKATLAPLVEVIMAIGTCLVLGYGARLALAGKLSPGVLIVFLLYLGKMYKPMRDLSKMTDTVSEGCRGFERIRKCSTSRAPVRDTRGPKTAPNSGPHQFGNVSFSTGTSPY